MAQPHAKPESHEFKRHGDPLEPVRESNARTSKKRADPIPFPDNGGHARSAAAHLGDAKGYTRKAGDLRASAAPGTIRQPPQEISRAGKQHRD